MNAGSGFPVQPFRFHPFLLPGLTAGKEAAKMGGIE